MSHAGQHRRWGGREGGGKDSGRRERESESRGGGGRKREVGESTNLIGEVGRRYTHSTMYYNIKLANKCSPWRRDLL